MTTFMCFNGASRRDLPPSGQVAKSWANTSRFPNTGSGFNLPALGSCPVFRYRWLDSPLAASGDEIHSKFVFA